MTTRTHDHTNTHTHRDGGHVLKAAWGVGVLHPNEPRGQDREPCHAVRGGNHRGGVGHGIVVDQRGAIPQLQFGHHAPARLTFATSVPLPARGPVPALAEHRPPETAGCHHHPVDLIEVAIWRQQGTTTQRELPTTAPPLRTRMAPSRASAGGAAIPDASLPGFSQSLL